MAILLVTLLCLLAVGLFVALVTLPRWCVRSHRRIWRLRDDLADDILSGRLPKDSEAVRHLFDEMEDVLREKKYVTLINLGLWKLAKMSVGRDLSWPTPRFSTDGLDDEQLAILHHHRKQFDVLLAGLILTSSWLGVALIFYCFAQTLLQPRRHEEDCRLSTFDQATDQAVRRSRLVQRGALEPFMLPV